MGEDAVIRRLILPILALTSQTANATNAPVYTVDYIHSHAKELIQYSHSLKIEGLVDPKCAEKKIPWCIIKSKNKILSFILDDDDSGKISNYKNEIFVIIKAIYHGDCMEELDQICLDYATNLENVKILKIRKQK